jgi:hypothetical protein
MYIVRYSPRFHLTAVCFATYYRWIREHHCIFVVVIRLLVWLPVYLEAPVYLMELIPFVSTCASLNSNTANPVTFNSSLWTPLGSAWQNTLHFDRQAHLRHYFYLQIVYWLLCGNDEMVLEFEILIRTAMFRASRAAYVSHTQEAKKPVKLLIWNVLWNLHFEAHVSRNLFTT